MDISDPFCHTASIEVTRPADMVLDYISDGLKHSDWTLGSLERRDEGDGLYSGISIFNGNKLYIRLHTDRENRFVIAHVGPSESELQPTNVLRVMPGPMLGLASNTCVVSFMTWRKSAMSADQWRMVCSSHETEMFIIKDRLEKMNIGS
jgi:hypothetical protein